MRFLKENLVGCGFLAASSFLLVYARQGRSQIAPSQDSMLFPSILFTMMVAFSLLLLVGAATKHLTTTLPALRLGTSLICASTIVIYTAAMFQVGFIPATLVFLGTFPFILGYRSWIAVSLIAVCGTFGIWWAFSTLLNIFLPETPLAF